VSQYVIRIRERQGKGKIRAELPGTFTQAKAVKTGQSIADDYSLPAGCKVVVEKKGGARRKKAAKKPRKPARKAAPKRASKRKSNPHRPTLTMLLNKGETLSWAKKRKPGSTVTMGQGHKGFAVIDWTVPGGKEHHYKTPSGAIKRFEELVGTQGAYKAIAAWEQKHGKLAAAGRMGDLEKASKQASRRKNAGKRSKKWIQKADAQMERAGTEGAFTAQAKRAGYDDPLKYARHVKKTYEAARKKGKTAGSKGVPTLRTYRRAMFALNAQK
jgi:hypothetical protein